MSNSVYWFVAFREQDLDIDEDSNHLEEGYIKVNFKEISGVFVLLLVDVLNWKLIGVTVMAVLTNLGLVLPSFLGLIVIDDAVGNEVNLFNVKNTLCLCFLWQ